MAWLAGGPAARRTEATAPSSSQGCERRRSPDCIRAARTAALYRAAFARRPQSSLAKIRAEAGKPAKGRGFAQCLARKLRDTPPLVSAAHLQSAFDRAAREPVQRSARGRGELFSAPVSYVCGIRNEPVGFASAGRSRSGATAGHNYVDGSVRALGGRMGGRWMLGGSLTSPASL